MLKYESIQELIQEANRKNKKISEIVLEDQGIALNKSQEDIYKEMELNFDTMIASTKAGLDPSLRSTSGLTGGEGYKVMEYQKAQGGFLGGWLTGAIARGMATSNCNAAMGKVVATPTAGSCGILPGILGTYYEEGRFTKRQLVLSLMLAGGIGMVIAKKASISGAEGGCQAECGSAAAMAAAMIVELEGGSPKMCGQAVALALVNQMGLICDPVAGLVEIPCIVRNGAGIGIATVAATMALAQVELQIPVDECILAMKEVGENMSRDLKETARGGLATTPTGRKLAAQVFGVDNRG